MEPIKRTAKLRNLDRLEKVKFGRTVNSGVVSRRNGVVYQF